MTTQERIQAQRKQVKSKLDEAENIAAAAVDENGAVTTMTDDQQVKYEAALADVKTIRGEIENLETLQAQKAELLVPEPAGTSDPEPQAAHVYAGPNQKPDGKWGFRNLGEFAIAVHRSGLPGNAVDPRIAMGLKAEKDAVAAAHAALYEGYEGAAPTSPHLEGGTTEGFMVPVDFREEVWEAVMEVPSILSMMNPTPTSSNVIELGADESTPWGATGIQVAHEGEASQLTESKLLTAPRIVKVARLNAFVTSSEELLQDAPRLNDRLMNKAPLAINWQVSEDIVNGNGVNQALGWFSSGAPVSVAKVVGQSADTIEAQNVADMFAALIPGGHARSFWMVNSDAWPQLLTMTLGNNSVFTSPQTGFTEAPTGFLFGRPVVIAEHAQTLGDKGDLHLVDPAGYTANVHESGMAFAESAHLFFDFNVRAFRWTFRFGGAPYLSAPIAKDKGSGTLSNFVLLDARA